MKRFTGTHSARQLARTAVILGFVGVAVGCNEAKNESGSPSAAAKSSDAKSEARRAAQNQQVTLGAGTDFTAALQTTVATDKNNVGDRISLRTVAPVGVSGQTIVPAGSTINAEVTHVEAAGRVKGGAELTLRFVELVTPDGRSYPISCEPFRVVGEGDGRESAKEIGGGAVGGAIVGGILGGKDGALKGAAVGGVLGTGVAVATKGDQIVLPAGQQMKVSLATPVAINVRPIS